MKSSRVRATARVRNHTSFSTGAGARVGGSFPPETLVASYEMLQPKVSISKITLKSTWLSTIKIKYLTSQLPPSKGGGGGWQSPERKRAGQNLREAD
ncbi:hypothetical protein [robinz microvirus RP_75]|nr:hypothetical protein [robinz microvirus RP_75]